MKEKMNGVFDSEILDNFVDYLKSVQVANETSLLNR